MRNSIYVIASVLVLLSSCGELRHDEPYASLCSLTVQAVYPEGYLPMEGVGVRISNMSTGDSYLVPTDVDGKVLCTLPIGIYDVAFSELRDEQIFSGVCSRLQLTSDKSINISLNVSKAGKLVIKEIYCGGCSKAPLEGTYQSDKYIIVHNNSLETQYLDSLCLGSVAPYNSTAASPWKPEEQDFVPVIQCIWQIGGDGSAFPLEPGQDAVIVLNGAIDHSAQYPRSVNLNKSEYFVCFNETYFTNVNYHPAPGDQIRPERILNVVIKTGKANAYTFSINSPATVIFKAEGQTIQEFVTSEGAVIETPGSSNEPVVAVPIVWVMDAVEVFSGSSEANRKRLPASLDAGAVSLSAIYLGHTLLRNVNQAVSESLGFEVLADTNNSSMDFVESEIQSLHE